MLKKIFVILLLIALEILCFKILQSHATEKQRTYHIYLDAGHGGIDDGASHEGILEDDINLNIVLELKQKLEIIGVKVTLTRENDNDLASEGSKNRKRDDIKKRVKLINESKADMFISVHCNSISSSAWSGAQTFYNGSNEESMTLAKTIQGSLVRNLGNTTRKAKEINNIYLIDNVDIPGSLVEVGFLSNPAERNLLKTKDYQSKIAKTIYIGVLEYFHIKS